MIKTKSEYLAFTLAEVLITLGIIGIVAGMTIPTLMNNSQEQTWHSGAKVLYSELQSATTNIIADNNGLWDNTSTSDTQVLSMNMKDAYKQYFKYIKDGTDADIRKNTWYTYKGTSAIMPPATSRGGLLLANGASLRFYSIQDCSGTTAVGTISSCGDVQADINGDKTPNMLGKDVYEFVVTKTSNGDYKFIPSGIDIMGTSCAAGSTTVATSYGCTAMVINGDTLP